MHLVCMEVQNPDALDTIDRRLTLSSLHTTFNDAIVRLSQSKDIAVQDKDGLTRLHYAVLLNDFGIIELILEQPTAAELANMQDLQGQTPLHLLLASAPLLDSGAPPKIIKFCSLFLERGADPKICTQKGENALHYTVKNQSNDKTFRETRPELLRLFVNHGVPIDSQNCAGETTLHYLCKTEGIINPNLDTRMELLPTLLACRANPNACTHTGETPLHYTITNQLFCRIPPLVQAGANLQAETDHGDTPLHYVFKNYNDVYFRHLSFASTLLELKANPNAQNKMGITPFYALVSRPCGEQTDALGYAMLNAYGANPNVQSKEGFTPLHAAVGGGHLKWVQLLLAHDGTDASVVHAPSLRRAPKLTGGKTPFDLALEMMLVQPQLIGRDSSDTVKLEKFSETGNNSIKAIFTLLLKDLFKRTIEKVNANE